MNFYRKNSRKIMLWIGLIALGKGLFLIPRALSLQIQALSIQEGAPLFLQIGEQRVLPFPDLERYSVSGNCLKYVRLAQQSKIMIKAMRTCVATLTVVLKKGITRTQIIRVEQKRKFPSEGLLQALNSIHSTEVIDQGDQFIFRGSVSSQPEASALASLFEKYSAYVIDETHIEHAWLQQNRKELASIIQNHPTLKLYSDEGTIAIKGGLPSASLKEAVIRKIKSIQPLTRIEIQTISDSTPTIYFKVFLLEVKREFMSEIGIDWTNPVPASFQFNPAQFLFNNTLDVSIRALSQQGRLRVLSSPELVVRVPGQAELFAGGEIPIRERKSKFHNNVLWKSVGLSLKLDVKEFGGNKVRLAIETEMSHVDDNLNNDDIPGVQSNRLKTQVDGFLDKPLLLSGLLQESLRERIKGLPALSRIPILGKLFGSEDYQNDRSELVAILLPHREVPSNPLTRVSSDLPKGYLPLPRVSLSAEERDSLKGSRSFPWNIL